MKSEIFEARFSRRLLVSIDFTRHFDYHAASVPQPKNLERFLFFSGAR